MDEQKGMAGAANEGDRVSNARWMMRIVGLVLWCVVGLVIYRSRFGTAVETGSPAPSAKEEADGREPIVVEPTTEKNPPIVLMDGDRDPLLLPEFTLINFDGSEVTSEDLRGKEWLASFIFTRCAYECPKLLGNLHELHRTMKDEKVMFVTITVDPEYDRPERMAKQAEAFAQGAKNWLFLSGEKAEILNLLHLGFRVPAEEQVGPKRKPGFEFAHSVAVFHVDGEGKLVGKYDGRKTDDLELLRQVLAGKKATPEEHRVKFAVAGKVVESGNEKKEE